MTLMEKVLLSGSVLFPLGFGRDISRKPLPDGARLIAGTASGRFLCLSGSRDAVFYEANRPGVLPVRISRSFRQFLRVLIAAGDLNAVEKLILSESGEAWEKYRRNHPKTVIQKEKLRQLRSMTGLRPSSDPYGEVRSVMDCYDPPVLPEAGPGKEYETVELTEIVF